MVDTADRVPGRIVHEAELVHPTVDALTRALIGATPASWRAAQLVITFTGAAPVISSPEGHRDVVALTPAIETAIAELARLRLARRLGWTAGVLMARQEADGTWAAAIDWHYGGLPGDAPRSAGAAIGGASRTAVATAEGGQARHEALVARAEAELAAGEAADAMGSLGEALVALPGDTFDRPEAGWIFVRMAGIRLGMGDPKGAVRNAQSALRCAGWESDARALLRLGQGQQLLADPAAGPTLVAAYRRGGDAWFASVAPELLAWVRAAAAG